MKKIFLILIIGFYVTGAVGQSTSRIVVVAPVTNALNITSGAYLTGTGASYIVLNNINSIANNGSIILNSSGNTIKTTGTTSITQSGTGITLLNNLVNNTSSTFTLAAPVSLYNQLSLTSGTLASAGFLTLKSLPANTAVLLPVVVGAAISGDVTVERYISSSGNRAYRLLTPSVNTATSIHINWQENATSRTDNPKPTYGTHITGSKTDQTNGFDGTVTGQGSLFTYNQSSDQWVPALNTTDPLAATTGYLIYIRGDRSLNLDATANALPSSNTTLRAKGTVLTGTQAFLNLTGNFSLVTNPYPSAINWGTIYTNNSAGFANYYTYVDPNINDRGGYVTVRNDGVQSPTTTPTPANYPGVNIQSGQAFFVKATGTQTLTVREIDKSTTNNIDVFRTATAAQQFTATLFYNSAKHGRRIADGVTALYDNTYNAALDGNDAIEINNFDENIAIARGGKHLSIEERPILSAKDTLALFMNNMKQQAYEFDFTPTNFDPNMIARLVDKYSGNSTYLNVTSATIVPFSITGDAASSASDRFYIVFAPSLALPVTLTSVKAFQKNTGVQVEWIIQQENNMDRYEVERSANGQNFTAIGSVASKGNSNVVVNYNFFDAVPLQGVNFYRIKAFDKNGKATYSEEVKVNISSAAKNAVTISPNPVTGSSVAIQINLPKGNYTFILTNKLGQQLANKVIQHAGGITTETLEPSANFAAGIYQLKVKGNGINITEQVIKK